MDGPSVKVKAQSSSILMEFFVVFLSVLSLCYSVAGRAGWSQFQENAFPYDDTSVISRRTSAEYYTTPEHTTYSPTGEEKGTKGGGDGGEEGKKEEGDEETSTAASEPAPFIWTDIKVPASFLRIEYMIGYSFMGLMYGLGFLVLFQSLVIPVVKFLTAFTYIVLVSQNLMDPITLQDALQQLPPN